MKLVIERGLQARPAILIRVPTNNPAGGKKPMARPLAGLLLSRFQTAILGGVRGRAPTPCAVGGDRRRCVALAAGNPPLLIAALQQDQHAGRAGTRSDGRRGRPATWLSSGAFAGA